MEFAIRLASDAIAPRYPHKIRGPAQWQSLPDGAGWRCVIDLPDLPAKQIIAPSFASLDNPSGDTYQCRLSWLSQTGETQSLRLNPVPSTEDDLSFAETRAATTLDVSGHIDCWHSEADISNVHFEITLQQQVCPAVYLLVVTSRALQLPAPDLAQNAATNSPCVEIDIPNTFSQMQAAKDVKHRICSPTALAMLMSRFSQAPEFMSTVSACYDPATKAYGSWPLAIRWAAQRGVLGAVETFHSWASAQALLQAGYPLVCSIRFETDKLTGAPLKRTGGHLVLLYGIEDQFVLVKDPAGETVAQVNRHYAIDEFAAAWLTQRGAAYLFCDEN